MARGTFICATAVALQGVASSGRTCEILFIAGRRRRRKKRERGEGVCVKERERREGKRNDKNRGKERGREGSGGEKKKKGSLPLERKRGTFYRVVAPMQMHTRRSILRDTLVLAFRKMDFTRGPFEIYYTTGGGGEREVNSGERGQR